MRLGNCGMSAKKVKNAMGNGENYYGREINAFR